MVLSSVIIVGFGLGLVLVLLACLRGGEGCAIAQA